jgi:hypothetical protein
MRKRPPKWLRKWRKQEEASKLNWRPYSIRNKALKEIGFASYSAYLASPLWSEIRASRLKDGDLCSCCPSPATLLHHDTYYKTLLLGDPVAVKRDLYPLCRGCHLIVEFDGERKRSWGEAIRVFRRRLYKHTNGMSKGQMIRGKIAARRAAKAAKAALKSSF